ncbi:MAG: Zn-dependent protease [Verrucomicrobiales bacterium]|nr:Zn-dependent protease [Verrucomicrobiales bacterium]
MDGPTQPPPFPKFPPPPQLWTPPPPRPPPAKWKKFLAPFVGIGLLLAKFKTYIFLVLKWKFLLTGLSMLGSVWVYSLQYGWFFAIGIVMLIFVHEMGHVAGAKHYGLKVSAPVFIPFVGAFILLKEMPKNSWIDAAVAIAGPIAGTLGAIICYLVYLQTGSQLFNVLAYWGFMLNLFNLIPIGMLDGGRIALAITPLLWIVGLVIAVGFLFVGHFNPILLIIVVMAVGRIITMLRNKDDAERQRQQLTTRQRLVMGSLYFLLVAFLAFAVAHTNRGMSLSGD